MFADRTLVPTLNVDASSECAVRFSDLFQRMQNAKLRGQGEAKNRDMKKARKDKGKQARRKRRNSVGANRWHRVSPANQRAYWYNAATLQSQWNLPPPHVGRVQPQVRTRAVSSLSSHSATASDLPVAGEEKRVLVALIDALPDGLNTLVAHSKDNTAEQRELLTQFNTQTGNRRPLRWLQLQLLDLARESNTATEPAAAAAAKDPGDSEAERDRKNAKKQWIRKKKSIKKKVSKELQKAERKKGK